MTVATTATLNVAEQTVQMETVLSKMERVRSGYHRGNWWLYHLCLLLGIILQVFMRRHQTLIGVENLKKIELYRQWRYRIVLDFDHFSTADIPAPLCLFWDLGYRQLVRSMFFIIGLRWGEKFLGRGADRCYVVPEPLIPDRPHKSESETPDQFAARKRSFLDVIARIRTYNDSSWAALREAQKSDRLTWASSQATRSRSGMSMKSLPGAVELWRNADLVVPIALEGTAEIMPIGSRLPRFWKPLTVIVGEPLLLIDGIPSAEELGRARAQLHLDYGNPYVAGEYYEELTGKPLPPDYQRRLKEN